MKRALLSVAALASLAATAAALAAACSGSIAGGGGGGGGTSGYCAAVSSYAQKCAITDPCSQAIVRDCAKVAGSVSVAAANAATMCVASEMCPSDASTTSMANQCYTNALAAAPPTAAQQKLAADYCKACAAPMNETVAACAGAFYAAADGGSSSSGIGSLFLFYSDDVVTKVDQMCTPTLGGDAGAFGCAFGLVICGEVIVQESTYTPPECHADGGVTISFDSGTAGD